LGKLEGKLNEVPKLVEEYIKQNPDVGQPPVKQTVLARKIPTVSLYYYQDSEWISVFANNII
jgi:hypothetical protein